MPTRTINLKLVIPRSDAVEARAVRQSLWRTHAEVNAATAHYERHLLLLRGRGYQTAETILTDDQARTALLVHARQAQDANATRRGIHPGSVELGSDDQVTALVVELYAAIIPSVLGKDGSAQAANAHLSPLTDPASEGFMDAGRKLDRAVPNWVGLVESDPPTALDVAQDWLASDASLPWRSDTGSPANWLRKARAGDSGWPKLFKDKLDVLVAETQEGLAGLYGRLRALHLVPLFPAYFKGKIADTGAAVTPWDRLAFRLAAAHLLSWESWSRRAADEHARRVGILSKFRDDHVTDAVSGIFAALRAFERERSAHLSTLGLGDSTYLLMRRQLRNWPDLRKLWLASKRDDPAALVEIANKEQARLKGRFGDPAVFSWLAARPNQHVWRADPDAVTLLATLNAMEALVGRSRETALMTLPDAVAHPRAVQWSSEGDSNFRPYRLRQGARGDCHAQIRVLAPRNEDHLLVDGAVSLPLAPSDQFHQPVFGKRAGKATVTFSGAGVDTHTGVIGSADLLLDRPHLEHRHRDALVVGDIGPAWLKLSLDLDPLVPADTLKARVKLARHFQHAAGKATGHEAGVKSGSRVLSIDLGVGTFAACSVFVLTDAPVANRFCIPLEVGDQRLWAQHDRSFHLTLLDEITDRTGERWRREQDERVRRLRRALSRYRRFLQLSALDVAAREPALAELNAAFSDEDVFPFEMKLLQRLVVRVTTPDPVWKNAIDEALQSFRVEMGAVIKVWRGEARARAPDRHSGPTMWAIQHLTNVRRLLVSWSLLGRRSGDVRRLDKVGRGVFASKLLAHIDALKENRLKTGADMIVQAARGYQRDKAGRWRLAHDPCDVVLFEDLSRYRMLTDRPRRENSQLMLWAHRAMAAEVTMQGELYGLTVSETAAAFSSRYHARTMTPGIRCRSLTKLDLNDDFVRERLAEAKIDLDLLHAGDLVPWDGGETFVCPRAGGGLWQIDADINAAQNLQRRFWTRHSEAFRIPCQAGEMGGQTIFVPRGFGQRLLGAMGGHGVLETIPGSPACRWRPMKPAALRKLGITTTKAVVGDGAEDLEAEALQGLADEALQLSGKVEVFFRDPSGVMLPKDRWYPQPIFWGQVKARLLAALNERLAGTGASAMVSLPAYRVGAS